MKLKIRINSYFFKKCPTNLPLEMGAKTGPMAMVGYFWDSAPFYPIVTTKAKIRVNEGHI